MSRSCGICTALRSFHTKRDRPELAKMIEQRRDDDTVVVTRLDRLARSTRDLLDIAEKLKEAGAGLRSLAEPWADTTSPAGRMVLTVFAGIAGYLWLGERLTARGWLGSGLILAGMLVAELLGARSDARREPGPLREPTRSP